MSAAPVASVRRMPPPVRAPGWAVVIPVKGSASGKSRLGVGDPLRGRLAIAFAVDTVRAARAASSVREVVVVAPRDHLQDFAGLGVRVLDDPSGGLLPALRRGSSGVHDGRLGRALLLGDLPALRSEELDAVLRTASRVPRAFVSDGDTGTVLATARAGVAHRARFGPGSRGAHRRAGYLELAVPPSWGLAHDVDTALDLAVVRKLGVGPATSAVLRSTEVSP